MVKRRVLIKKSVKNYLPGLPAGFETDPPKGLDPPPELEGTVREGVEGVEIDGVEPDCLVAGILDVPLLIAGAGLAGVVAWVFTILPGLDTDEGASREEVGGLPADELVVTGRDTELADPETALPTVGFTTSPFPFPGFGAEADFKEFPERELTPPVPAVVPLFPL